MRKLSRAAGSIALLVAVIVAGCGTRVERGAVDANQQSAGVASPTDGFPGAVRGSGLADGSGSTAPSGAPGGSAAAPAGSSTGGAAAHQASGSSAALGSAGGAGSSGATASAGGAAGGASGGRGSGSGSTGGAVTSPSGGGSSGKDSATPVRPGPGGGAAAPVPAPTSGSRSPVLIANVGTYSGPAASTLKPNLDGVQLWTRSVNARGGVNGHEVKLLVYDDAGDPSRHRAQVQEAVENKKVIAFVGNAEALTGPSSNDYIASHRVPVVGIDGGWDFPYDNPMYFVQVSSGTAFVTTFVLSTAQLQVPAGKKKLGLLACAEAQACADAARIFPERAKGLGLDLVYTGRASIAQPDFTAECLSARNAGVETFFVMMDGNSIGRISSSCTRQSFKPQYASASSIILDRFKADPNLDGLIGSNQTFPYFQTGTPATDEFAQAYALFGKGLNLGSGVAVGWTAGKLFEKAAANLPEPPTSDALLRGLWSIKNDTLGGLTYPLTFTEGKTSERKFCWTNVQVLKGRWTSPDGYKLNCGQ